MKKFLLFAGLLSFGAYGAAQAQSYNPYYPSNVSGNYSSYNQQSAQRKSAEVKHFSIGLDYVGSSFGMTDKSVTLHSPLTGGADYTGKVDDLDNKHSSLSGNIGWRPWRYLGFEAFYQKSLENSDVVYRESYAGYPKFAQVEYDLKSQAYGIDAIGYIPLSSWFELLATAGVANYDITGELKFKGYDLSTANPYSSNTTKLDENKVAFRYGGGAQIWLSQRLAFRAMYRYTTIGGTFYDDISEFSLGVRYNF